MKLDDAKALLEALESAIGHAERNGSDQVDLQGALSAQLGQALDELEAAIRQAKAP